MGRTTPRRAAVGNRITPRLWSARAAATSGTHSKEGIRHAEANPDSHVAQSSPIPKLHLRPLAVLLHPIGLLADFHAAPTTQGQQLSSAGHRVDALARAYQPRPAAGIRRIDLCNTISDFGSIDRGWLDADHRARSHHGLPRHTPKPTGVAVPGIGSHHTYTHSAAGARLPLAKISPEAANSQSGTLVCHQLQLVVWELRTGLTAGFSRASQSGTSPAEAGSTNKVVGRLPPTKVGGKQDKCDLITTDQREIV